MREFRGIRYGVLEHSKGKVNVSTDFGEKSIVFNFPCSDSSSCTPYSLLLPQGIYKFELWGAQGGYSRIQNEVLINELSSGKGSYVSGILPIIPQLIYFYILVAKAKTKFTPRQLCPKADITAVEMAALTYMNMIVQNHRQVVAVPQTSD